MLDVSGSMAGEKIAELNHAIRAALPSMRDSAEDNPHAEVEVRAMTFSTGYRWVTAAPVPLTDFAWSDVTVSGITDMGAALKAMAVELSVSNMPDRGLPPVIVLVSDGHPTDDFTAGLHALLSEPWGQRAMRIAIGLGDDADFDVLRRFIGRREIEPLTVRNPGDLVDFIRFASTTALKAASSPQSLSTDEEADWGQGSPPPPPPPPATDDDQVW
ncbi:vWA domain-containing protein [Lentzea sp. NPDC004789]